MHLTDYLEGQLINHIFRTGSFTKPTTLAVALFTAAPSDAGGGTEVTGGSYARVAVAPGDANWSAPSAGNGTTDNVGTVTFPQATADWGLATHWGVFDATSAGNLLVWAPLTASRNITTGATPSFGAGALTVQMDN